MTTTPTTTQPPHLEPLPSGFVRGRQNLHQIAFFAIAPKRYQETGRLGLRHTGSGFGTPTFDPGEQIRVEEDLIVRQRGDDIRSTRVTTLREACNFLEIPYREKWFEKFHDPLASVGADVPLEVEPAVTRTLEVWQEFARVALERARRLGDLDDDVTELQLWPEHFDQAFEMGSEALGRRASYGASPGDDQHEEPYLYVAPWLRTARNDPFWNDSAFAGASLSYEELRRSDRPEELAFEFFAQGFSLLAGGPATRPYDRLARPRLRGKDGVYREPPRVRHAARLHWVPPRGRVDSCQSSVEGGTGCPHGHRPGSGPEVLGSGSLVRWLDRVSAWTTGIIGDNPGWLAPSFLVLMTLAVVGGRSLREDSES